MDVMDASIYLNAPLEMLLSLLNIILHHISYAMNVFSSSKPEIRLTNRHPEFLLQF